MDLLRAVRLPAARDSLLSPSVTRRVIESLRTGAAPLTGPVHPGLVALTEREREVLGLIGEGLSNDEVGRRLYVSPATARTRVSPATARTYVSRAMSMLSDRARLAIFAYRAGLVC